jgi:DNA-directed RNA polymerase sigma subunit (sigma70/sigma32)
MEDRRSLEFGEKRNISKERIRQLQTRAIEQVRALALHGPVEH